MNKIVREPAVTLPADLREGLDPKAIARVAIAEEPRPSPELSKKPVHCRRSARPG